MSDEKRREAARQFYQKWVNRGKEDEDDRSYWLDFLQKVLGIDDATDRIDFQKKVIGPDGNTKRIDAYIPETRVLIEQKSLNIDLSKPQSGHNGMTPYEQAKMYDNSLPVSEKAKWIILSNFAEIWVYDMDTARPEPVKYSLIELRDKYPEFEFLINQKQTKITHEMEVSVKAGEFVGLIYDALYKQYKDPDEASLRSLNMLCVRLVFCLYAEDALIFGSNGHMFHDYLEQFETKDLRRALIDLFKVLDQDPEKGQRDKYLDESLAAFPYVNGGLFADEDIEIPPFTDEIRDILLSKASAGFDWSQISPTIFGAVFESTLNPETRRSGGMHYTSIENIHKVIDPLFLDELKAEFEEINAIQVEKTKKARLEKFQDKLSSLSWFDPACGSGNFLTETFISIRRLENKVIRAILDCDKKQVDGQIVIGAVINPIKVGIEQFYGIEINDFAVTVAKTALWIAESQMMKETEDMIHMSLDFLPLKTNAFIHEGNALQIKWEDIVDKRKLSYIMGNPPFLGSSLQSSSQKKDIQSVYIDEKGKTYKAAGKIDYVSGWYFKAAEYINNTNIQVAFVSTNSITQGEQVASIWKPLYERFGIHIDFAYRTFIWDSEASAKANVHCVIISFSCAHKNSENRIYYDSYYQAASNINAYLLDADNIFVEGRTKALCEVPEICSGFKAADNGYLILNEDEKKELLSKEPSASKWIRRYSMGVEFINKIPRYCLWLKDISPTELRNSVEIRKRVQACKEWRENATPTGDAFKLKDTPHLFRPCKQFKDSTYIAIPLVSSSNRRYIPMDYINDGMIPGNNLFCVFDALPYHFGVLTSNVHMAWIRAIGGFLKSDWRYSKDIVYNNFPWPTPTEEQKKRIEETAQGILDARAKYPNSSLADLYDPLTMPPELLKAHQLNDKAVMQAYGFSIKDTSEADCVAKLMQMYKELTEG
ncbi:MAG: SAM-dependent DNA methyltransferase [Cellulosilyticum sp.]|nr:SAM-dependent DNA methyltransferase [Cellulosilyticum sp.]